MTPVMSAFFIPPRIRRGAPGEPFLAAISCHGRMLCRQPPGGGYGSRFAERISALPQGRARRSRPAAPARHPGPEVSAFLFSDPVRSCSDGTRSSAILRLPVEAKPPAT